MMIYAYFRCHYYFTLWLLLLLMIYAMPICYIAAAYAIAARAIVAMLIDAY